jgi:hypothetical protein
MRLQLDDNERGAFNYLIGGVLLVLFLRGLAWAMDAFGPGLTPDGQVLRPFQHGYAGMRNQLVVTGGFSGLTERMVLAVVVSVGATFLVAFAINLGARALRRSAGLPGRWATRLTLVATLSWTLYAALYLPVTEAVVHNGSLEIYVRHRLVGEIPWPGTKQATRSVHADDAQVLVRERPPTKGCDGAVEIILLTAGQERGDPIAIDEGICAPERLERLHRGSEAAALLQREMR